MTVIEIGVTRVDIQDFGKIVTPIAIGDEQELATADWLDTARDVLAAEGAVLLRTNILRPDAAQIALGRFDDELLDDAFWSTPRSKVEGAGKTLTATEYPSPRTIPLHSEMAYMPSWPRFVAFHSIDVADTGGETTICDIEAVSASLGDVLRPFADKGVTYRRTFQKRVDVTWQQAFQTDDRADVEAMGRRLGMKVEWFPNDVLVTTHSAQGVITTEDGRMLYFNQAHLFHPSSLSPDVRRTLEKVCGAERMPRLSMYGDGTPIDDATLDKVRAAFEANQTRMVWSEGDILILDNMRYAHGRLPFTGSRKLHVALARQVTDRTRTPIFA